MESTVENDTMIYFKNKMEQRFVCVYLFIYLPIRFTAKF